MMKTLRICLCGFGNVAREFCILLDGKKSYLEETYGYRILLTGIATGTKGVLSNSGGLDVPALLSQIKETGKFYSKSADIVNGGVKEMMHISQADVFIELSTLSIADGQPATEYIDTAFDNHMHVITANKGPVAWNFKQLEQKAKKKGCFFFYETIVMDGSPVFNLVKNTLHGNKILEISGILNGTSNYVLTQLENGISYGAAVKNAQKIGLAEADPALDMDGLDGAAKLCALVNILMNGQITPNDVSVESIAGIRREEVIAARREGYSIKYVCRAKRKPDTDNFSASVKPEKLPLSHAYSTVKNTSAAITFHTDLAGEITLIQTDPKLLQTAYGIYSDLITLLKALKEEAGPEITA